MMSLRPSLQAVSEHLLRSFPLLDPTGQQLSLALYRRLAQGEPVVVSALARELGIEADEAARRMQSWPAVYYDNRWRVIGYWGLTLRPTTHRLRVDGRELYTWCAWDTLFLPALLDAKAEVESLCRGNGQPVRLTVGPDGVESAEPAELFVSFLLPTADAIRNDMIASFCHHVHFFRSPRYASAWLDGRPGAFLLSAADAYEVGRCRNDALYPALCRRSA